MVLCGNFSSKGVPQGNAQEIREYQGRFCLRVKVPTHNDSSHRQSELLGGSDLQVSFHHTNYTFRFRSGAYGPDCQFNSSSTTAISILRRTVQATRSEGPLCKQPLQNKILRSGNCCIQGRYDGSDATELGWDQA